MENKKAVVRVKEKQVINRAQLHDVLNQVMWNTLSNPKIKFDSKLSLRGKKSIANEKFKR
jgi:hypothetical protein